MCRNIFLFIFILLSRESDGEAIFKTIRNFVLVELTNLKDLFYIFFFIK